MLQYSALDNKTLGMLKQLMRKDFLSSARLVGGTALALQYGHRKSIDLDFFGFIEDDAEHLKDILRTLGNIRIIKESANIKQYIVNGVKMVFINYPYPWIDMPVEEDGIRLASDKDISAMKINAI